MVSTTTFGSFPGVRVSVAGGAITGVAVGREQKYIIVGNGDPSNGSASVNDPTQITARLDADRKFGDDSELADAMKGALANGANIGFLYGVMAEETTTSESVSGSSSGTLADAPIIEDLDEITVTDDVESTDVTVNLVYESPPSSPSDANTVNLNPITGEWDADESSDYTFDYTYPDEASALSAAQEVIDEGDNAVIGNLYEAESVATTLSGDLNTLRGDYRMTFGVGPAEPNETNSDGNASYDTSTISTSVDNDAYFMHAPARKDGSHEVITGELGGLMAGSVLDESIYNKNLTAPDIEQRLSASEAQDIRDNNMIPIVQPRTGGSINVAGNASTSTETDFVRDYFTMRIVDQAVLIAKAIGDAVLGRINDQDTRDTVENQIRVELRGLVQDGLIEPGEGDAWFVDVYEVDANEIGIDLGVTPNGVTKRIDTTVTINS